MAWSETFERGGLRRTENTNRDKAEDADGKRPYGPDASWELGRTGADGGEGFSGQNHACKGKPGLVANAPARQEGQRRDDENERE